MLVDTGPLVALLRRRDEHHSLCSEASKELPTPFVTCWPVLTEAGWILRNDRGGARRLLALVEEELINPVELGAETASWMSTFFDRFHDQEPQIADASLIYLAEREGIDTVFTLDQRDFWVYRTTDGRALRIVPER